MIDLSLLQYFDWPVFSIVVFIVLVVGFFLVLVFFKQGRIWSKIRALDEIRLKWANFHSPNKLTYSYGNLFVRMKVLNDALAINIFSPPSNTTTQSSVTKIFFSDIREVKQDGTVFQIFLKNTDYILKFSVDDEGADFFLILCRNKNIKVSS